MFDAIAIGELLADIASTGVNDAGFPIMNANPGGAPANFLAALASFNMKTAMIANVGDDSFGTLLIDALKKAGVSAKGVTRDADAFTTLAFVNIASNGERSFSFARKPGADTRVRFTDDVKAMIDETKLLHFGSLSLTDEPAKSATKAAVEYAKSRGRLISFDPNLRAPLWRDLSDAKREMLYGMKNADIIKLSDEEASFLFEVSPQDAAELLINEYGTGLVLVTLGGDGCIYKNKYAAGRVKAIKPNMPVTDTTGAGDIFFGSAVCGVLSSKKPPCELNDTELQTICRFACAVAGISVTRRGGISSVPSIGEVKELLEAIT